MTNKKKILSLCLILIHNNNAERYKHIRPALDKLCVNLSQIYKVEIKEISYRPEIILHSTLMTIQREVLHWRLSREWCKYCHVKVPFILNDAGYFLINNFNNSFRLQEGFALKKRKRNSFRETVITANHILAWNAFVKSDSDFMICFEDDAVFKEDSIQRVKELLDTLSRYPPNTLIYVDLAGGCEYSTLKIDALEIKWDSAFKYYSKPVTNTACSYLISKPLARLFVETVNMNPKLRTIRSDWLMNKIFIMAAYNELKCTCMHAVPSIFKHGSVTGEYYSLMSPDRNG